MFLTIQEVEAFFNSRKSLGIKPGLERINRLLALLDYPQNKVKAIHIAGTNGKGSTVQFLKNALQANGYQVGVFTSPSLTGLTGHIYLNHTEISEHELLDLCNEMYPIIKQMDTDQLAPTEFEIITALAFLYFSKHGDIALIEAGMGGREDTTNCFQPIISIITNVARDHSRFLGNTLAEIAFHKAGVIKKNAPVIAGMLSNQALTVIEAEVSKRETTIYHLGEAFTYEFDHENRLCWNFGSRNVETSLQMFGEHQMANASIALMAIEILYEIGYSIDFSKVAKAIGTTKLSGRFEIIHTNPIVVLDGAHNPAGISEFIKTAANKFPDKESHLLFAAFKDKELNTMLHQLENAFSSITLTTFHHPRAAEAETLYEIVNIESKRLSLNWKASVDQILRENVGVYFITGSLHFISMVRAYLVDK